MNWLSESLAFIGGIGFTWLMGIKYVGGLVERKVQQKLDQGLEDHKAKLTAVKDATAFDYQRKMHDFTKYSSSKHELYPDLYKDLLLVKSEIFEIRGLIRFDYNYMLLIYSDEHEDLMLREGLVEKEKEEVRIRIKNDMIPEAIEKLSDFVYKAKERKAKKSFIECRNRFYKNELFYSDEIVTKVDSHLTNLVKLLERYQRPGGMDANAASEFRKVIESEANEIKKIIKFELSIGQYEKDKE